jgi:hypothetical protein
VTAVQRQQALHDLHGGSSQSSRPCSKRNMLLMPGVDLERLATSDFNTVVLTML